MGRIKITRITTTDTVTATKILGTSTVNVWSEFSWMVLELILWRGKGGLFKEKEQPVTAQRWKGRGYFFFLFKIFYLFVFRESVKRGRETSTWETSKHCLSYAPWLGTEPTTQACAVTRNQTCNLSLCRMTPNQLSHTGQGGRGYFYFLSILHV